MTEWWSQYNDLIIASIFYAGAVVSTLTGKTLARGTRHMIFRTKDPSTFWWVVAIYYFVAFFFVALYLFDDR
jgi:hypothetical protein